MGVTVESVAEGLGMWLTPLPGAGETALLAAPCVATSSCQLQRWFWEAKQFVPRAATPGASLQVPVGGLGVGELDSVVGGDVVGVLSEEGEVSSSGAVAQMLTSTAEGFLSAGFDVEPSGADERLTGPVHAATAELTGAAPEEVVVAYRINTRLVVQAYAPNRGTLVMLGPDDELSEDDCAAVFHLETQPLEGERTAILVGFARSQSQHAIARFLVESNAAVNGQVVEYPSMAGRITATLSADLDGDPEPDIVFVDSSQGVATIMDNDNGGLALEPGEFHTHSDTPTWRGAALVDVDGQEGDEVVVASDRGLFMTRANEDGDLAPLAPLTSLGDLGDVRHFVSADLDEDGLADFVVSTPEGLLLLLTSPAPP